MFLAAGFSLPVPQNQTRAGAFILESIFVGKRLRSLEVIRLMACILLADNNLIKMIRYLYRIGFLTFCVGLPLHAVVGPHAPITSDSEPAAKRNLASTAHS